MDPYVSDLRDYCWTEKAYEMLESGELTGGVTDQDGIVTATVEGRCPRCRPHALAETQVHTAVVSDQVANRGVVRDAAPSPAFVAVTVKCGCDWEHPDAPAGVKGCGVSFRLELLKRYL